MEIEGEKVILFKGESNFVMFATALADSSAGGFKWVRYLYKDGILKFSEGILPDKRFLDKISENEEVIDSGIEEVKFEYLPSGEDEWEESWDFGKELPAAVRVKIAYFQPFLITIPMGLKSDEESEFF